MYHKITNPNTGRKVSIYTKLGQNILQNYILNFQLGGVACAGLSSYYCKSPQCKWGTPYGKKPNRCYDPVKTAKKIEKNPSLLESAKVPSPSSISHAKSESKYSVPTYVEDLETGETYSVYGQELKDDGEPDHLPRDEDGVKVSSGYHDSQEKDSIIEKCLNAYTTTLTKNNWQMSYQLSNTNWRTIDAKYLKESVMKGAVYQNKEQFIADLTKRWYGGEDAWILGNPETGDDVEYTVFLREFNNSYNAMEALRKKKPGKKIIR